jgi:hypothetical protein
MHFRLAVPGASGKAFAVRPPHAPSVAPKNYDASRRMKREMRRRHRIMKEARAVKQCAFSRSLAPGKFDSRDQ